MQKLLVAVCIWSLVFSPLAWAENEATIPSTDTPVAVETILDPSPGIETTEQTETPVDAISPESESNEQALADISQPSEEIILPESEIIALPDETIVNETVDTSIGDSLTPIVNEITELQALDPVVSLFQEEE